ncbi:hypothetical protein ACFU99_03555 [Streptomyces sp. NPDC057654]|uniref:hypothetical protein n=1 Tax=Streptomyces sp. NPDC057654 TaxID=3346196 RepID=UPI0036B57A88
MTPHVPLLVPVLSGSIAWLAPVLRAVLTPRVASTLIPAESYATFHDGPAPTPSHQRHGPDSSADPPVPDPVLATEEQR